MIRASSMSAQFQIRPTMALATWLINQVTVAMLQHSIMALILIALCKLTSCTTGMFGINISKWGKIGSECRLLENIVFDKAVICARNCNMNWKNTYSCSCTPRMHLYWSFCHNKWLIFMIQIMFKFRYTTINRPSPYPRGNF